MHEIGKDVKLEFAVDLAVKFIKRGANEEDSEGIATQEGTAGIQGFCKGDAAIESNPLTLDKGEQRTVVDSPREGGLGRMTLNGVKTEGQDSKMGEKNWVNAAVEMNGPPFPMGGDTRLEGIRQPPEDEVQLKGGGVFEGVEVKVGVGVGDTEEVTDTVAEEEGVTLLVGVRVGVIVGEGVDVGVGKGRQVS